MLNLLCCWLSLSPSQPRNPSNLNTRLLAISLKTLDFPLSSQILRMVLGPFQQISFSNISVVLVSKIQNKNKFNTLVNCPPWIHSRNGGGNYSCWGSLGVGGGDGPLATRTRRMQLCEKRITSREDSLGATPACWPRNTPQPTQRARILFPDGKFSKPALRREPRSPLGQPHCPSNEELKSVPLAAPLEFTASPTPVFWTQNQIYGLEHRVSYRTNFEMCREKKMALGEY